MPTAWERLKEMAADLSSDSAANRSYHYTNASTYSPEALSRIRNADVRGKEPKGDATNGDPRVSKKAPALSKNEQALEEAFNRFRYGKTGGEHSVK